MEYHFRIHKEGSGYWAQCIELEGCFTQANSLKELQINMRKALNLYIEEPESSNDLASLPDNSIRLKKNIVKVMVEPKVAFAFQVRFYRLKHKMTQHEAAKKLGFSNVYSYQRLESRKSNPCLETIVLLKKLFPELSVDFSL